jgi:hypothetical protein
MRDSLVPDRKQKAPKKAAPRKQNAAGAGGAQIARAFRALAGGG